MGIGTEIQTQLWILTIQLVGALIISVIFWLIWLRGMRQELQWRTALFCFFAAASLIVAAKGAEMLLGIELERSFIVLIARDITIIGIPIYYLSRQDYFRYDYMEMTFYGTYAGFGIVLGQQLQLVQADQLSLFNQLIAAEMGQFFILLLPALVIYIQNGVIGAFIGVTIGILRYLTLDQKLVVAVGGFSLAIIWELYAEYVFEALLLSNAIETAVAVIAVSILGGIGAVFAMNKTVQAYLEKERAENLLKIVVPMAGRLSAREHMDETAGVILADAQLFCRANAGVLVLRRADELLFVALRHGRRRIVLGGGGETSVSVPPLPLIDENGMANNRYLLTRAVLDGERLLIDRAEYDLPAHPASVDFGGDFNWAYSLTLPLVTEEGVIGALQLFDPHSPAYQLTPFTDDLVEQLESYALLAAAILQTRLEKEPL